MAEEEIGKVISFFSRISVAAIEITAGELRVGDTILIKGPHTDFKQSVESMQVENQSVSTAKKGDKIGVKVTEKVRNHDLVYKVTG